MARIAFGSLCLLLGAQAQATSLWDGEWFVDRAQSHGASSTFSISTSRDGTLTYATADDFFLFSPTGGGSAHAGYQADTEFTAIHVTASTLDYVESTFGKEKLRRHMALSGDGTTLYVHDVQTQADGVQAATDSSAVRIGRTSGLDGTWKVVVDQEKTGVAASSPTKAESSPASRGKPTLVVFTAPDGAMTWYFPFSGEVIRGHADGQRRPITGPLMPSNLTFTWNVMSSPNRLQFIGRYGDHVAATAIEELSDDGATLTDTIFEGGADVPSVFVLHKGSRPVSH